MGKTSFSLPTKYFVKNFFRKSSSVQSWEWWQSSVLWRGVFFWSVVNFRGVWGVQFRDPVATVEIGPPPINPPTEAPDEDPVNVVICCGSTAIPPCLLDPPPNCPPPVTEPLTPIPFSFEPVCCPNKLCWWLLWLCPLFPELLRVGGFGGISGGFLLTSFLLRRIIHLEISAEARSIIPDGGKILLVLSIVYEFTSDEATLKSWQIDGRLTNTEVGEWLRRPKRKLLALIEELANKIWTIF